MLPFSRPLAMPSAPLLFSVGPLKETSNPPALALKSAPPWLLNVPTPRKSSVKLDRFALNVPWLLMMAPASARLIEPAVQVALPVLVQVRPASVFTAPLNVEGPAVVKLPAPLIVPPDQLNGPVTVTLPAPVRVPADTLSVLVVRLPLAVSVPPASATVPLELEVCVKVRSPVSTRSCSALVMLRATWPPAVTVMMSLTPGAPTSGMSTSSPAVGTWLKLQFAAVSQLPVKPIQVLGNVVPKPSR